MYKNVSGQSIGAQLVNASDGGAFTGAVTVYVTGDAGTQAVGSVGSGACVHEGNGFHTYAPAAAETNYDVIAFTFTGSGAVPVTVQVFTEPAASSSSSSSSSSSASALETTGDAVADAIAASAEAGIRRAESDGQQVEEHALRDRIEAAKFAAAQAARRAGGPTVRLVRILPPGAV